MGGICTQIRVKEPVQGRKYRTREELREWWFCLQKHGPRLEPGVQHQPKTGEEGVRSERSMPATIVLAMPKRPSMLRVNPHHHSRQRRILVHPVPSTHIGLPKVRMNELIRDFRQFLARNGAISMRHPSRPSRILLLTWRRISSTCRNRASVSGDLGLRRTSVRLVTHLLAAATCKYILCA